MTQERRITALEYQLEPAPQRPFLVVDRGEGPSDPEERDKWLRSKVPEGVTNVLLVRIVRELPDAGGAYPEDDTG